MKTIIFNITTIIILLLPLTTSLQQQEQQQLDKTKLINAVFEDANENCNLPIGKYSDNTVQTSLEICKKGMAWLKVECDIHYDNVELCRENMPAIKTYLTRNNFDERDTQYHHDEYNERLSMNLNTDTMTVTQDERVLRILGLDVIIK